MGTGGGAGEGWKQSRWQTLEGGSEQCSEVNVSLCFLDENHVVYLVSGLLGPRGLGGAPAAAAQALAAMSGSVSVGILRIHWFGFC